MDLGIRGKSALVVASSTGLGRAVAVGLGSEGARVTLCARSEESLGDAARAVEAAGGTAHGIPCDITDAAAIDRVVAGAAERFGGVDILVTNCGGPPPGRFDDLSEDQWSRASDLVFHSVRRFIGGVLPSMRKRGWGRIVPIVSVSAKQPIENLLVSNALRPAIVGLSKTLSQEVARDGITVNCVAPTYTRTDRLAELADFQANRRGVTAESIYKEWEASIPVGRLGKPEEFADLVLFLASERAAFLTGGTYAFDGGSVRSLL